MLGRRLEQLYSAPTTTPGAPALRIEGLEAGGLRDFSAVLRRGEILGVAALEGQGQRELFMALAGAQSFKGTVVLEGERYAPRTPRGAIDLGVALVPEDRQSEGLLGPMTVQENITVSRLDRLRNRLRMIDSSRELEAAIKGVARLNLPKARLEDRVGVLSGGNQQKTIFARGLLSEPRVLLLYDCTRGVDVGTKAEIFSLMQQLAAEDVAILFYSSDLAELVHMTHQTIVLAGHRVAAALEGPALTEERLLRGMMFDRETPTAVAS
jgi:ABC-type sugar transport system ATPase subunit